MGTHPFVRETTIKDFFIKMEKAKVKFFEDIEVSDEVKDFIRRLLEKDPQKKLGFGEEGFKEVLGHDWFVGLDYETFWERKVDIYCNFP